MKPGDLTKLGVILKTHGTKGRLIVSAEVELPEDISNWESVFLEINQKPVPFFVSEISQQPERISIRLEEIKDPESAKLFLGHTVFIPKSYLPPEDQEQQSLKEIVGYLLKDRNTGEIGEIQAIYEYPEQWVVQLTYKEKKRLIPLHEDLIIDIDAENKVVEMDLPEGLLDI